MRLLRTDVHREDAVTLRLRSRRDEVNECGGERKKERPRRPAARVNETRFGEERREEKRQRRRKWESLASKKDETMYNTVWKGPTSRSTILFGCLYRARRYRRTFVLNVRRSSPRQWLPCFYFEEEGNDRKIRPCVVPFVVHACMIKGWSIAAITNDVTPLFRLRDEVISLSRAHDRRTFTFVRSFVTSPTWWDYTTLVH